MYKIILLSWQTHCAGPKQIVCGGSGAAFLNWFFSLSLFCFYFFLLTNTSDIFIAHHLCQIVLKCKKYNAFVLILYNKTQSPAIRTHKRWRDILLNHKSSKSYSRVVSSWDGKLQALLERMARPNNQLWNTNNEIILHFMTRKLLYSKLES